MQITRILILFLIPFLGGCTLSQMDVTQHETWQRSYTAGKLMVDTVRGYTDGMAIVAADKHALQRRVIELNVENFWDRHTSGDGRLVSAASDGSEQPMSRADVELFMADRQVWLDDLGKSERNAAAYTSTILSALGQYGAGLDYLAAEENKQFEARQSMDAVTREIFAMLGTGVGIAFGATVAP